MLPNGKSTTINSFTVKPVHDGPVYSGHPVNYGHRTTSLKSCRSYIYCKVDLYIAVTLHITDAVTLKTSRIHNFIIFYLHITVTKVNDVLHGIKLWAPKSQKTIADISVLKSMLMRVVEASTVRFSYEKT